MPFRITVRFREIKPKRAATLPLHAALTAKKLGVILSINLWRQICMTTRPKDALAVADLFYDAATDLGRWRMALQALSDYLGAAGAGIWSAPFSDSIMFSPSLDDAIQRMQADNWAERDTLNQRAVAQRSAWDMAGEHALVSDAEIAADPYFAFRRDVGLGGVIARADTRGDPASWYIIAVQRQPNQPFPEGDAADIARRLLAHAARARAIAARAAPVADWSLPFAEALEACPVALAVVTPVGRVLHANRAFARIDALRLDRGQLVGASAPDTAALMTLIAEAALPTVETDGRDYALVRRHDTAPPVLLRAAALTPERGAAYDAMAGGGRRVLLMAVETAPEAGGGDIAGGLRRLGLTRAETRLAQEIGRGLAPREVAAALGVTEHTVRSQMRAIFAKLDLSRQSDLVRLTTRLERLAAPERDQD